LATLIGLGWNKDEEFPLVLVGGNIAREDSPLSEEFLKNIREKYLLLKLAIEIGIFNNRIPKAKVSIPTVDPVEGAVMLAVKL